MRVGHWMRQNEAAGTAALRLGLSLPVPAHPLQNGGLQIGRSFLTTHFDSRRIVDDKLLKKEAQGPHLSK